MRWSPGGTLVKAFFLAATITSAVGCSSSWPKDMNVRLDTGAQDPGGVPSVAVHLIGVRKGEVANYKKMSVSEYWSPGGPSRQAVPARKELFLGPGATSATVSRNDPIWKEWNPKTRPYLVVLADLRVGEREGTNDPRRLVLPLDNNRWPAGLKVIKLVVRRDAVQLETPWTPKG